MKNILVIESSPKGDQSASREVTRVLVQRLVQAAGEGNAKIIRRDLAATHLPHVSGDMIAAYFTPEGSRTAVQKQGLKLSDELIEELLAADYVVIGAPMWNFTVPSSLKAWIDHVSRAGRTFTFTANGPVGLVQGKKVYLVVSSGSIFSQGPYQAADYLVPYLRTVLGFLGLTNAEVIRAEGTNDPASLKTALDKAKLAVEQITV